MAERGPETLRHGPMKPRGLTNAHQPDVKALCRGAASPGQQARHALQHGGLPDEAETWRAGAASSGRFPASRTRNSRGSAGLHRNTFLNSPKLLDESLRLKAAPRLRFAGQITGVEGYVESAAMGLMAGRMAAAERQGRISPLRRPPPRMARSSTTSPAAISRRPTAGARRFQPMNVNFGLFPPVTLLASACRTANAPSPANAPIPRARSPISLAG